MYLVTAEQMRQVDRKTIEELGIPEIVLMENAGKAVADFLQEQFDDLSEKMADVLYSIEDVTSQIREKLDKFGLELSWVTRKDHTAQVENYILNIFHSHKCKNFH